ncbi:MAG: TetR/AcrR family transcriptional regulator [Lachnospiraceae bacterium]|nr:TetR/AcrR family transcriptional regulator [Lachnospiraceae bacterium]
MNDKFFNLKREKQDRFINAALKIFSENGYQKASTDDMVREAGISKGLLFHYFGSKLGLYEFVYNYSTKLFMMEYGGIVSSDKVDFFEVQKQMELAKRNVMVSYPYMNIFLERAFREESFDVLSVVAASMDQYSDELARIYSMADISQFKEGVDPSAILKMCLFVSDGVLNEQFRNGRIDPDAYYTEVVAYLDVLERNLYKEL